MENAEIDALCALQDELARQVAGLQIKDKKHSREEHAQPTPSLSDEQENSEHCLNCSCRSSPSYRRNTCISGRGVYLGLVRAGDVADLSDRALMELDDGLKAITMHLVPRSAGAPPGSSTEAPLPWTRKELLALLDKVSLRVNPVPEPGVDHFAAFRNTARGRDFRLEDARQGLVGNIPKAHKANLLYFETFVQLVRFRGIDLEALP
ncbi:hypothetical protein DFP73DRAFT_285970 [Morchella snyderi]|nr:hypothetical protein DFP73DRAFT_285970 [Morchella snyderi]